jgi:hypothetical protein
MEYLSLYDYLKKPAGGELGREVAQAASKAGIKLQTREVDNPKYTGIVYLYPKDFLDFILEILNHIKLKMLYLKGMIGGNIEDDLPF